MASTSSSVKFFSNSACAVNSTLLTNIKCPQLKQAKRRQWQGTQTQLVTEMEEKIFVETSLAIWHHVKSETLGNVLPNEAPSTGTCPAEMTAMFTLCRADPPYTQNTQAA